ncbi:MAG: deoxyribose-phosphate aldolase [Candidatus Gastranaerophilales bacterium]|nr:deoxyribose-phosphate aldolase [Candidatus Gastranaerophilales bacterium]
MEMNKYIEHTLLKPTATNEALEKLYQEAKENHFKGVCVNPINVKRAAEVLKGSGAQVITVVGFPLGAMVPDAKAFEAKRAIEDGADEVDMVLNIQAVKNAEWDVVTEDIKTVKAACGKTTLKVIIETDYLTKEEIVEACKCAIAAKADYVKTSTGFVNGGVGAKAEDVKLMYDTVNAAGLKVKASGGIRDRAAAEAMVNAGAFSLGTSSGIKIIQG